MSVKRDKLEDLLWREIPRAIDPIPQLTWKEVKGMPEWLQDAEYIYKALGGQLDLSQVRAPRWHISLEQQTALQLDEQLHFNRYRLTTLRSAVYRETKGFEAHKYRTYCSKKETECLKSGQVDGKWTSPPAEKHFGQGSRRGMLHGEGAPAWKLRALQDYWQDLTAAIKDVRVIRLSIWDEIMLSGKLITVNEILSTPHHPGEQALVRLVQRKVGI